MIFHKDKNLEHMKGIKDMLNKLHIKFYIINIYELLDFHNIHLDKNLHNLDYLIQQNKDINILN